MANPLIDTVRDVLTSGGIVNGAASALGISPAAASKALDAGGSTVLAALATKAKDPAVVDELYTTVQDPALASTALEDPTRLLGTAPEAIRARDLGSRLTNDLFGNRIDDVVGTLARHAGVSTSAATSLMGVAVPLVLRAVGNVVRSGGLTIATLQQMLMSQQGELANAVPTPLANFISRAQIYDAGRESRPRPPATTPEIVEPRPRAWWALPLALVPLLLLAVWFVRSRGAEPGPSSMSRTEAPGAVATRPTAPPPAEKPPAAAALPAPGAAAPPTTPPPGLPTAGGGPVKTVHVPEINQDIRAAEGGVEMKLLSFLRDKSARPDENTWFEFDRLVFDTNAATLAAGSNEQLENLASILKAYPAVHIKIGGYTDNTGDAATNRKLSQDRADAVKAELVGRGIPADRIETEGYGEQHPVASNDTEEGRAKNRRVALRVIQPKA